MTNDISEDLLHRYLAGEEEALQEVLAIIVDRDRPKEIQ